MKDKAWYYGKWFFGAVGLYLVLDNWSGTNALVGTGFKGLQGFTGTLQGRGKVPVA